jgi:hypothetical protein
MFDELDNTIAVLLHDNRSPVKAVDVSFITPDKDFKPQNPTIDLFLYDVKENRELRDPTPILQRTGTTYIRQAAPVRIECSYIVTCWSDKTKEAKVAEEHRLLAQALKWLSGFPVIPTGALQGSMATNQLYAPPMMVAQLDPNKNSGEFWDALAIAPRPAFYLSVTVSMDLESEETGPLVTTHTTQTSPDAPRNADRLVQIAGRVLDPAGAGIAGAIVEMENQGQQAITGADGLYTFLRAPVGAQKLRVAATGFQVAEVTIEIPDFPDKYNVPLAKL